MAFFLLLKSRANFLFVCCCFYRCRCGKQTNLTTICIRDEDIKRRDEIRDQRKCILYAMNFDYMIRIVTTRLSLEKRVIWFRFFSSLIRCAFQLPMKSNAENKCTLSQIRKRTINRNWLCSGFFPPISYMCSMYVSSIHTKTYSILHQKVFTFERKTAFENILGKFVFECGTFLEHRVSLITFYKKSFRFSVFL